MIIYGRNAVKEALGANCNIEKAYVQRGINDAFSNTVINACKDCGAVFGFVDKQALDKLADGGNHQGVALVTTDFEYSTVEDILAASSDKNEPPFLVLLDGIEDPHNLGALVRSAECLGAHGIVIPKRRAVGVTDTVVKVSCGAVEHLPIAKVTNLNDTIRFLKTQNIWVYCAIMNGQPINTVNLSGPIAIVIGGENTGVSSLTEKLCDGSVAIMQRGKINSLNASVAGGIVMYEIAKQRLK